MSDLRVSVIIGSVRPSRFGVHPARWIHGLLDRRDGVDAVLLDLVEYPMPFFSDPVSPMRKRGPYSHEVVERWTAEIGASDAFVMLTPEYNAGYSAVIKNAIDWVGHEWRRKPVAFVAYGGGAGGTRAVQQLRQVVLALGMCPVQSTPQVPFPVLMAGMRGEPVDAGLAAMDPAGEAMIDDLLWWARALRAARAGE